MFNWDNKEYKVQYGDVTLDGESLSVPFLISETGTSPLFSNFNIKRFVIKLKPDWWLEAGADLARRVQIAQEVIDTEEITEGSVTSDKFRKMTKVRFLAYLGVLSVKHLRLLTKQDYNNVFSILTRLEDEVLGDIKVEIKRFNRKLKEQKKPRKVVRPKRRKTNPLKTENPSIDEDFLDTSTEEPFNYDDLDDFY